ncbi:apoptosis-associated speck-like protein containing a CARD [Diretmus argenteus]
MAGVSIKREITNMLEDLQENKLKRFRDELRDRDRAGEPRVRRKDLQGNDCYDTANLLVSTFTEFGALKVSLELLRLIGCNREADELDRHFVDVHRSALIQNVSMVDSILDELLDHKVMQQDMYDLIRSKPTSQDQMRLLYSGPLKGCGTKGKDILYTILETNHPMLIDNLKGQ